MRWSQTTLQVTRDSELWFICITWAGDKQFTTSMASSLIREHTQRIDIRGDISYF